MRILQLCNRIPWPLNDGGAIGIYHFTKGYQETGCEVTMLAMNTSKHRIAQDKLPLALSSIADLHTVFVDNRVQLSAAFFNLFGKESYNIFRFKSKQYSEVLESLLGKKKFDVVHFDGLYVAPYLEIVRRHSDALAVMRAHNVEYMIWQRLAMNEKNILKKKYLAILAKRLKKYEAQIINQFDCILAISEEDKKTLQQLGCKTPVEIIPAGLDIPDHIAAPASFEELSVFHIGSMDWMPNEEGVRFFINDVWPSLHAKLPRLQFYVAGKNMKPSWFKMKEEGIHIVGEVADARSFMLSKNLVIVPLLSGGGMRIKIMEAMELGKTIISTTVGAEGIPFEDGKNILIADSAHAFVTAIEDCILNPQKAIGIGKEARILAENYFNIKKIIERLLKIYERLQKKG